MRIRTYRKAIISIAFLLSISISYSFISIPENFRKGIYPEMVARDKIVNDKIDRLMDKIKEMKSIENYGRILSERK